MAANLKLLIMIIATVIMLCLPSRAFAEMVRYEVDYADGEGIFSGIAFNPANGCLYLSELGINSVLKISHDFDGKTEGDDGILVPDAVISFEHDPQLIALSPDRKYIAVIFPFASSFDTPEQGEVRILDANDLTEVSYAHLNRLPLDLCYDPAGEFLYVSAGLQHSENGLVTKYKVPGLEVESEAECGPRPICIATDGNYVFATDSDLHEGGIGNSTVHNKVWVFETDLSINRKLSLPVGSDTFAVDKKYLYVGLDYFDDMDEDDPGILLFNLKNLKEAGSIFLGSKTGTVAFSSNGTCIAVNSWVETPPAPGFQTPGSYFGNDTWILHKGGIHQFFDGDEYGLEEIFTVEIKDCNSLFCMAMEDSYIYYLHDPVTGKEKIPSYILLYLIPLLIIIAAVIAYISKRAVKQDG